MPPVVLEGVERVVVDSVDWVLSVPSVDGTVTVAGSSLESSPATMIRPTARPITSATRIPIIQRVGVSIAAMLPRGQDPVEDAESLVDLTLADDQGR